MKYTPGPWGFIQRGSNDFSVQSCSVIIAKTTGCTHFDEANARLIASAPELLEVLKKIKKLAVFHEDTFDNIKYIKTLAQQAIAKAEGSE